MQIRCVSIEWLELIKDASFFGRCRFGQSTRTWLEENLVDMEVTQTSSRLGNIQLCE